MVVAILVQHQIEDDACSDGEMQKVVVDMHPAIAARQPAQVIGLPIVNVVVRPPMVLFAVMEWLGAVTDIRKEKDRAAISWRWPVPR